LEKIGGTGIKNQWLSNIKVHGFDATNRCHAGLELHINWLTHTIEVAVWGEKVTVEKTSFAEDVAPEVMNAIEVFNQAVIEERLTTEWRVSYAPGVDVEHVRRELGLSPAAPITWAGIVSSQSFGVSELRELKVRLLVAESDETAPTAPEQAAKSVAECLFERIKHAVGEG
jgi:hypothetical protein